MAQATITALRPNACRWKFEAGSWTVIESTCEDGKVCAREPGTKTVGAVTFQAGDPVPDNTKVPDDKFREAVNALATKANGGTPTIAISPNLTLANGSTFDVDCH